MVKCLPDVFVICISSKIQAENHTHIIQERARLTSGFSVKTEVNNTFKKSISKKSLRD
jgi:hypothetical protein